MPDPVGPGMPDPAGEPARPAGPVRWRVSPKLLWLKLVGVAILSAVAAFAAGAGGDPMQVLVAGLGALGMAGLALRDLVAPVRLAADSEGVTVVAGFAHRVRLPWSQIQTVRVDVRSRYGLRSEHLEIDTGESLYLLSANDLNADLADAAAVLNTLRTSG